MADNRKLYVYDITLNPKSYVYFSNMRELELYLEKMLYRFNKKTRADYMNDIAALGWGTDTSEGRLFITSLGENLFEMGVVKNNSHVRCSVFETKLYNKSEYGD